MKNKTYSLLEEKMKKIADIGHSIAVLSWDKEVNLPIKAAESRGRQISTLSGLAHELFTSEKIKDLLSEVSQSNGLNDSQVKNIDLIQYDYDMAVKFSSDFVVKKSIAINKAYHAWIKARKNHSFDDYKKDLAALVDIKKEEAKILGYESHPYDALLNQYERGLNIETLERVFGEVKTKLLPVVKKVLNQGSVNDDFLKVKYPHDDQWDFGIKIIKELGYDFDRGRQDISPHPFTVSFSHDDVRITTRVDEYDFCNMLWSCIHEAGHGLYEQGLNAKEYGMPLGYALSLSMHESQSRFWENNIGRSLGFWKKYFPEAQKQFPSQLQHISLEEFYRAINKIEPNLIRTEADELHYHLHVLIRYEIEKELMEGAVAVHDLENCWNGKYKEYLGQSATDPNYGILQDVHWSHGSIGYFPTYSLGSFYAAQFHSQIKSEIQTFDQLIVNGDFGPILNWLRSNIHIHGRRYESEELCKKITGENLNIDHFVKYVEGKYLNPPYAIV